MQDPFPFIWKRKKVWQEVYWHEDKSFKSIFPDTWKIHGGGAIAQRLTVSAPQIKDYESAPKASTHPELCQWLCYFCLECNNFRPHPDKYTWELQREVYVLLENTVTVKSLDTLWPRCVSNTSKEFETLAHEFVTPGHGKSNREGMEGRNRESIPTEISRGRESACLGPWLEVPTYLAPAKRILRPQCERNFCEF